MRARSHRTRLLGALVLAAACALVWSSAAAPQQSETPSELWQEYPLDPEPGSPQPTEDAPQAPIARNGGEPADADGVDEAAAAEEEEPFPLVQVALALGLLLLAVLHGVSVLVRRSRVRLPERIGAVQRRAPPSRRRASAATRRMRTEPVARRAEPRPSPSPPAGGGGERVEVVEERAEVIEERAEPVEEPAEVSGERAEPAKPPRPKVPPAPSKKPAAQKPPLAKPGPSVKPPRPAKPPRRAKPVPAAKHAQAAKHLPAAKPPKPAWPAHSKPSPPKKPRAERVPGNEQPRLAVAAAEAQRTLRCSIYGWRNGPVADFYALATGLQGRAWVVERSPRFEWLAGDFPAEAREAHAALVEELVTAGWRLVGTEGAWYRQRFERPFAREGP